MKNSKTEDHSNVGPIEKKADWNNVLNEVYQDGGSAILKFTPKALAELRAISSCSIEGISSQINTFSASSEVQDPVRSSSVSQDKYVESHSFDVEEAELQKEPDDINSVKGKHTAQIIEEQKNKQKSEKCCCTII